MNIIDEWRDYCAVQERILELLKQNNTALAEIEKLANYLSGKEDVYPQKNLRQAMRMTCPMVLSRFVKPKIITTGFNR